MNTHGMDESKAQDELFRLLVENVLDYAIFVIDPEGRVQTWSEGAERLLGYTEAEMLGKPADVFFTPEDRKAQVPKLEREQALATGRGEDDRWHVRKDGSWFWASGVLTPLRDGGGTLSGFAKIMRDRTEWRRAEEARQDSEIRRAAVMETSLDGIITIDHEDRIVEFNPAAERIFGYRREDVLGQKMGELIVPPHLRAAHYRGMAHYLATGEGPVLGRRLKLPAVRADGTEFPAEIAIIRVPVEGTLLFTGYVRDISEREAQESRRAAQLAITEVLAEALSVEEAAPRILKAVCEHLDWQFGAFWVVDPQAQVLRCLDVWRDSTLAGSGFEAATQGSAFTRGRGLPGRVWQTGQPHSLADVALDRNFPRLSFAAEVGIHGALAIPILLGADVLGVAEFFSRSVRTPDADLLAMMATIGGQVGQFVQRTRSEQARRESDDRFRQLAENIADVFYIADTTSRQILYVSPAYERIWGRSRQGLYEAPHSFFDTVHPQDRERIAANLERQRQGEATAEQYRIVRPDQAIRWIHDRSFPVRDESGRVVRVAGIAEDVTDRKRAEEQLREETRLAETLHRVGRSLAAELDLPKIVQTVTDEATSLTAAKFGAFFHNVLDAREGRYPLYTLSGVPREEFSGFPIPRDSDIFESTFRGTGVVRLDDLTAEPRYEPAAPARSAGNLTVRSYLAVPVTSRSGEVLGGLFFGHPEPGRFTERHERLVLGITAQAAVAIDNARLFDSARRERLRAEANERHYRTLAEVVPQLVWTTTPEGEMDWCNQRWCDATGLSFEDSLGSGWTAAVHPDDADLTWKAWQRATSTDTLYEVEYRLRTRENGYRWYIGRAMPLRDEHGRVAEWFGTCTDIHDQKLSEESFRFLSEASAALAAVVDYRSTLQKAASLAVPRFGDWCAVDIAEPDGSLRRLAVAHVDPEKVAFAHELGRRYPLDPNATVGAPHVARTGESEFSEEIPESLLQAAAQDEEHFRMLQLLGLKSYLCVPMKVRGKVLGVFTFVAAESGRRYGPMELAMAEELAGRAATAVENTRLYDELREADRRKDEFLAMLAHELRNPLAPIRSGLDLLGMTGADGQVIEPMQQQVEHLVRLVDDLLDVSRIMRGKVELRREPVELSSVVARALETARPTINAHGHHFSLQLPPEPVLLDADPVRLAQVIGNLLNNAAKYTEEGGHIGLSVRSESGEAVITVSDNGIGIEPDLLPRVFDLFTQAERTIDRSQGGLGIGLTLVKRLVEMHGGSVAVQSEGPGRGSEFSVRLPLGSRVTHKATGEPGAISTAAFRILIVDDNVAAANMLVMLLEKLGDHQVVAAHDGPAALAAAAEHHPDIILLDIGLPRMDGYEVVRRLRQRPEFERTLVVALTGYGTEEDRRRSLHAGCDDHLVKPPNLDALKRILTHPKLPRH